VVIGHCSVVTKVKASRSGQSPETQLNGPKDGVVPLVTE
jgi:hypothetical protein